MFAKPTALQTTGLERIGNAVRIAQLSFVKGKPTFNQLIEIPITEHSENAYIAGELNTQTQNHLVVTAIDSQEVLVRPLDIKLKKEKDIDSVLSFQSEPLLPYPVESAILDRMSLLQSTEGSQLTLFAIRKESLQQHIASWNNLQIEPEVITCEPAALIAFSLHFCSNSTSHFIVHLSKEHTTCVLVREGKLLAAQSIHSGLEQLEQAAAQDQVSLENIDFATLSYEQAPKLFDTLQQWRLDITRLLHALTKQRRGHEVSDILFTGEGVKWQNLNIALSKDLEKNILSPTELSSTPVTQLQQYAIPIGAALSALPHAQERINFRQKEFSYPHPWKRLMTPLLTYFGACIGFSIALVLFGYSYVSYQENQLRQEYVDMISGMNSSYETFEKEYATKQKRPVTTVAPPDTLTQEDIADRLNYLHKELNGSPDVFPLLPNVPHVTDVLAWLSTHPIMSGPGNGLQIDSFNYTLVKRPEIKKPQEKYQVKIEVEFTSPTPKLAREFHDALIAPNDMVDPKGEVKWSSNKGKYRASFFLKDKTIYPIAPKPAG